MTEQRLLAESLSGSPASEDHFLSSQCQMRLLSQEMQLFICTTNIKLSIHTVLGLKGKMIEDEILS